MRKYILLAILWTATLIASAQSGLNVDKIFGGKYAADTLVAETVLSGGNQQFLRRNHLTTYASFRAPAQKYSSIVQPLVLKDGAKATGRNVRYVGGKLQYASYVLPSVEVEGRKLNRYLYYVINDRGTEPTLTVVFFEGTIGRQQAENLIKGINRQKSTRSDHKRKHRR